MSRPSDGPTFRSLSDACGGRLCEYLRPELRSEKGEGMARRAFEAPSGTRSSALWGTGNRGGESRSNALWGKGGRGRLLMTITVVALAAPIAAVADSGSSKDAKKASPSTFVAPSLLAKAESSPNELVKVIIQSVDGDSSAAGAFKQASKTDRAGESLRGRYKFVDSVAVTLKAKKITFLARIPGLTVTPDSPVRLTALPSSEQVWPTASASARSGARRPRPRRRRRRSQWSTLGSTRTAPTSTTARAWSRTST